MNIYLGNLNYRIGEADLEEFLSSFGTVNSVKIITDRETGRSKGFGFAEVEANSDSVNLIEEINGKDFSGRSIVAKEALPREQR